MSTIEIFLKKVRPDVLDPVYGTEGAAGCDIHADEDVDIVAGKPTLVSTGICMEIPEDYECQIRPRSGLALRDGIIVFNSPSTIDCDYRGEVKILLFNTGSKCSTFHVKRGMRIAQLVFAPVTKASFKTVDTLTSTHRGEGGWGSTGTVGLARRSNSE